MFRNGLRRLQYQNPPVCQTQDDDDTYDERDFDKNYVLNDELVNAAEDDENFSSEPEKPERSQEQWRNSGNQPPLNDLQHPYMLYHYFLMEV